MSLSRNAMQFFKNKTASLTQTATSAISSAASNSAATVNGLLNRTNHAASSSLAYARGGLTRTQAQLARLSPFAILAFAQEVASYTEQVFVHDDSSYPPTDYRFTYESSDFPNLRSEITEHISTASIEGFPVTPFVHDSTPGCTYSSAKIELSIEAGRAMSRFFSDGLDAAMSHMCPTDPNDSSSSKSLTQIEIIAICCLLGLAVVGVCAIATCRSTNRIINNSSLSTHLNSPPLPETVIHVRDSHDYGQHYDYDHHHHDYDHHHEHNHHHDHSTAYSNVTRSL